MEFQHVIDQNGQEVAVIVPIEAWRAILRQLEEAEDERDDTAMLLNNPLMRERLLAAKSRSDGLPWEDVRRVLDL